MHRVALGVGEAQAHGPESAAVHGFDEHDILTGIERDGEALAIFLDAAGAALLVDEPPVDPDFQGEGKGAGLLQRGLNHLALHVFVFEVTGRQIEGDARGKIAETTEDPP